MTAAETHDFGFISSLPSLNPTPNLIPVGAKTNGGFSPGAAGAPLSTHVACSKLVGMAEKRTKADKWQRQADQLEKKSDRRLVEVTKKKPRAANAVTESAPPREQIS